HGISSNTRTKESIPQFRRKIYFYNNIFSFQGTNLYQRYLIPFDALIMILFADKGSVYGVRSEAIFYNEANRAKYINQVQKRPYIEGTAKAGPGYWLYYDNYGNRTCWIKGRYNP
ncbi:MAG: hypothetical protein MR936_12030, partial [Eubacterium sp.]|nr:hypothetical protein [Eubacterium sp.]